MSGTDTIGSGGVIPALAVGGRGGGAAEEGAPSGTSGSRPDDVRLPVLLPGGGDDRVGWRGRERIVLCFRSRGDVRFDVRGREAVENPARLPRPALCRLCRLLVEVGEVDKAERCRQHGAEEEPQRQENRQ